MPRRASAPKTEVPFLTDKAIEQEAALLLAEFCAQQKPIVAPPIPIDEIIELHLKLTFEISDLQDLFHVADVHGAIWINERRLAVDQSLDPSQNPRKLGRYRFTLGHETGHCWDTALPAAWTLCRLRKHGARVCPVQATFCSLAIETAPDVASRGPMSRQSAEGGGQNNAHAPP
jgi:hypothetical protein